MSALPNESRSNNEFARKVLVTEIPEGVTENQVHIHFQKKKNGGGEIERVTLLGGGRAMVVFSNPKVAMNAVNARHEIKGNAIDVELCETEDDESEEIPEEEPGTVHVSGLPDGATENSIHIHFQKKKNNGGEVKKVEYHVEKNEAIIVFETIQVAKNVVEKEQVFLGKKLVLQLQTTDTGSRSKMLESDERERKSDGERTVLVFDLPEDAKENGVHIHFQKKKNMGGEVEKTVILPGNRAVVVFEDSEVARRVVETPQQMKGKSLTVTLLNKESSSKTKPREDEPEDEPQSEGDLTSKESTTLKDSGTPEIESSKVDDAAFGVTNLKEVDQMYATVTANVNPELMTTGLQNFWSDVLNVIQKSCGVQCHASAFGVLVTGSLSQVTRAGEILNLDWKRQCQNSWNFNQSNASFNQPGATSSNQMGRIHSPDDPTLDSHSSLTPQNQTFNQYKTANNVDGSYQRGYFVSSGSLFHEQHQHRFYQKNFNFPSYLRQPEWMKDLHNEMQYNSSNSYSNEYSEQNNYPDPQREIRYPPPGFPQHTRHINPQQFGYLPNTTSQYKARSPSIGEPPADITNQKNVEQQTPDQFYNRQNHKTTEAPRRSGDQTPKVDDTSLISTTVTSPVRSPNSTRSFHQQGYGQWSASPNRLNEEKPTTSFANEGAVWPNEKSSPANDGTKNYQPPGRNQQPPYSKAAPGGSTKSSNQSPLSSNGQYNPPPSNPDVYSPTSINPSNGTGSPSNTQPNSHFEKAPQVTATTPEILTNDQQAKTNPTAKNQTGLDLASITESSTSPSPSNDNNPAVSHQPVSPGINALTNNDEQPKTPEPSVEKQTSNHSSNNVGPLIHDQPDSDRSAPAPFNTTIPKSPNDQKAPNTTTHDENRSPLNDIPKGHDEKSASTSDVTSKRQPPDSDDQSDLSSGTNLTTSKTEELSGKTTGSITEKPPKPAEHIPDNQTKHKQQKAAENLNNENPCNDPTSVPETKPGISTEAGKNPGKKKTPVPPPRQPRPGIRHNAANFSSPSSKPTQPRQGSPSPKEPGRDSVADKPTTDRQATSEDENDEKTKKIKKLPDEDNMKDEVD